jgi:drug/metabolite transporter (DMT)-like permease
MSAADPIGTPIDRLALGAALVTVVLWASAFVGIRAVVADLSPGSIALGRLVISSIVLGAFVVTRPWQRPGRRDLVLIVASGLAWFAFYSVALNEAERHLDAGTASMLINTGPIFIAILAGVFLGEGLPARLLAGCAVAFAGTVVIGFATSTSPDVAANPSWGVFLCLAAALAYASGVTLQKPALRHVTPLQVIWIAGVVAAIACLPFGPGLVEEVASAQPSSIAWLVYLGIFPTAIGFLTWAFALSRTSAGRLGSTTYLIPPVVILMGWLLLGEIPSALALAGGALCIGGVIIARSSGRPWGRRASASPPAEA